MLKTMKIGIVLVALAAAASIVFVASDRLSASGSQSAATNQTGSQMSATQQIAHMAAAGDIHAGHAMDDMRLAAMGMNALQMAPASTALPADEAGAADRLAKSPRKGEFVNIDVGGTPMRAWVVRPQGKGPVVVVIQEIFGLSDWIRAVADQLAAEGFVAIAPDLLAGKGPNGGDSSAFASPQEVTKATMSLAPADVVAKMKAARAYGLKQPQSNGRSASVGFCFGGNQSFLFAIEEPSLNAAVVYYGTPPSDTAPGGGGAPAPFVPSARVATIKAPVLGLYGGLKEDARIGNTIAATEAKMKELGKAYEPHIFEGAGHGFLRAQMGNTGANMKATQQAWPLTVAWIKKHAG